MNFRKGDIVIYGTKGERGYDFIEVTEDQPENKSTFKGKVIETTDGTWTLGSVSGGWNAAMFRLKYRPETPIDIIENIKQILNNL